MSRITAYERDLHFKLTGMYASDEDIEAYLAKEAQQPNTSDRTLENRSTGGSTHYYDLPENATQLRHLIRYKNMSHGIGEAFSALYRLNDNGEYRRNLEKAIFYCQCELEYLEEGK